MPVQVKELADSRRHNLSIEDATGEIKYICYRDADESNIYNAVAAAAPLFLNGLSFKSIDLDPQGGGIWYATVVYGIAVGTAIPSQQAGGGSSPPAPPPPPPAPPQKYDPLTSEWSFETTGNTKHITGSLLTRSRTGASGATAPDHKGAIGVDGDSVNGVDIVEGRLAFTITRTIPALSLAYILDIVDLTGHLNDGTFMQFGIQEVLFLGASLSYRSPEEGWVGTFQFQAGKTRLGVQVGDILIPEVRPFDYVWFQFAKTPDAGVIANRPKFAYVERVYRTGDFLRLKL